ncbi:MAG TPA: PAS domain S-box protein [Acetobacteraceae bacterium]|nr:PAS domain S-box protein [Acetobacteraceae bacterium]
MLATFAEWLFNPAGLTPHGVCLLWGPGLVWMHALSDAAIGSAYFSIPLALGTIVRRRKDLVFRPVFWLFAAFILLCGTTHWLALLTLWVPAYALEGIVKLMTAVVSVFTAIVVWRLLPQMLGLPSPAQLDDAKEKLQATEARYRANFKRSPVPMHTVDGTGLLTDVSDSWLSLLGYERSEVLGRRVAEFQLPEARPELDAALRRLFEEGELNQAERRFIRKDGTMLDTLVSARTERNGDEVWAVSVIIDITPRRQAEAALRASEERLHQAQKMEAVGQLTGGVAHDFNNMLQGIAGGLDLMERRIAGGQYAKALQYIGSIRQSLDRAAGLTRRMLAFARRQALQPRPIHPDALVRGMEELIRRTVGPTINLTLRLEDGRWPAHCDPNQLESALLNLAINARDAMPNGGNLLIATSDRHLTRADLGPDQEVEPGDYIEITVKDDGVGMARDVLARAFEPFFTTKPTGQGTGLGLSQLYGFVRQSGGLVRLESAPGKGTAVHMFLPRSPEPAPSREEDHAGLATAEPAVAPPARGTVLVVDDEEAVRAQIADALREQGLTVLEAADGPAGLRIVHSGAGVDVLVTDVGLPGLNGRQLAEAARELRPGLPVLLITGYAGSMLEEGELAPGLAVLHKPFALETLAEKVRAVLQAAPVS